MRVMAEDEVRGLLESLFGRDNVEPEWDVARVATDRFTRSLYCPRLDYAIKPFNVNENVSENIRRIEAARRKHKALLEHLIELSEVKPDLGFPNPNPRCFMVIEVEGRTSRKHRLGSMINASALGKVAVIAAKDERALRSLRKLERYLDYLQEVGKIAGLPKNRIVLKLEAFCDALRKFSTPKPV